MGEIEFDTSEIEKTYDSVEEMFEDMEKEYNQKHPVRVWINKLFKGSLFGYAPWYSLSRPDVLFMDAIRQIKWAWQRVFRHWDDRASWSIDWWLNHILPDILMQLKENKHGTPVEFFECLPHDENYDYGDEGYEIAKKRWNAELDKMIAGFLAAKQIDDYKYETEEERETLELVFQNGMNSFVENYRNLWD